MSTSNGLLLIDKPKGMTSHDVVARVRLSMGERRVGHAGTLDPMATGLLVLAVGPSTRLLRFAQSETKRYEGVVTLGVATDSLDADGAVVDRRDVPPLTSEAVNAEAQRMLGPQFQTPPMVSAIKVKGQRLHALARAGVEVEREARAIDVTAFALTPTKEANEWRFDVTCSVGTYVRVLLSDLAERLGTIGHLSALRRLSSGEHHVDDALTLDRLDERLRGGETVLKPPRAFVAQLATIVVTRDDERCLRMGQRVALDGPTEGEVAAVSERGSLVAVIRRRGDSWQPAVVLPDEENAEHG
ncbi:MAG TPA: tRNA pseudouridine(55) synthase TruB [Acidimicrobiales bacterium]|jgi:tRNA pseudouridine55 synthase|nr:tRNA pseudouridine(55) synthase TruB [Acidimicrobiales bacterium]